MEVANGIITLNYCFQALDAQLTAPSLIAFTKLVLKMRYFKVIASNFPGIFSVSAHFPGVHLSGGSLVRDFGVHLSAVHLSGVHLSGGSLFRTFRRFGVATPRGRHSQGDAVLLKYIRAMLFS